MNHDLKQNTNLVIKRTRLFWGVLIAVVVIFGLRLFYVQIIHYGHYRAEALSNQLEQYKIPATRGIIEAHEGNSIVPIVLNQQLYTLYVDPTLVKKPTKDAKAIAKIIGGSANHYQKQLQTKHTRYVVIKNKLTAAQSKKILSYKFSGIGTKGQDYRAYPGGSLASQVLGFVNDKGRGEYGLEQALNKQLSGTSGQLKALTDANGVPLVASPGNIDTKPVAGDNVVTTLNMGMQAQMEQILKQDYKSTKSNGLSALIMDPNNGQIKAMANYPTYNPANYDQVSNAKLFQNAAVGNPIEPGSSMKTLTTSAALNLGAITPDESFYDPAHWIIDGFNITDIQQDGGPRQQSVASTLALSLNTGATWMLMQMSQKGATQASQINQKGMTAWHNYMVNHFRLGQPTGVEQGYEAGGYVPPPTPNTAGQHLKYANTAFGQGVTVTALQEAAALSSVLNGGTYYKPTLVDKTITPFGKTMINQPRVEAKNVFKPKVGQELIPLMQNVINTYHKEGFGYLKFPSNYMVGGKTGTAQVASPSGGYYKNIYNGTYVGFVGGNKPQYVIEIFNIKPNLPSYEYAGSYAAQPVFSDLAHMLIDDGYAQPKS